MLVLLSVMCLVAEAQTVEVISDTCPLDSIYGPAYYPQLNRTCDKLLFSPTEATILKLLDLKTGVVATVADDGLPGFDGRFGNDGNVYYVTAKRRQNNLIFRAGYRYNVENGATEQVLAPQHGQVLAVAAGKSAVVVGERESYNFKRGTFAFTRGAFLYVVKNGNVKKLQPVKGSVGYLWASVSPCGDKVVFKAVGKGMYVVDLNGKILSEMGYYMMPSWYDNDYLVAMNGTDGVQKRLGQQIYLVKADGTFEYALTPPEMSAVQPMAAGGKITYTTGQGEIHIMEIKIKD